MEATNLETTEATQSTESTQTTPEANQSNTTAITQQQVEAVKAGLLNTLNNYYREFIAKVNTIPAHLNAKDNAFYEFDCGFLWMKEAILGFDMSKIKVLTPAPAETPLSPEAIAAVV